MAAKGVMRSLGLYVSLCKRGELGLSASRGRSRGVGGKRCVGSHGGR